MLRSLEIRNYRNLRHLTIEKLGRINLLVGKNNTGKTSVLEAVAIYVNQGSLDFLLQLLEERGENYIRGEMYGRRPTESVKESTIIKTLSAIFSGRIPRFLENDSIVIGEFEISLFGPLVSSEKRIAIRFVKYIEDYEEVAVGQSPRRRKNFVHQNSIDPDSKLGIEVIFGKSSIVVPLEFFDRRINRGLSSNRVDMLDNTLDNYQFVTTKNIDREINEVLWDKISLTEGEDEVVNALKIIEDEIERVTFRAERGQERVVVAKLKSSNDVVPLRSMGDGINRILTIILAMVNCENGYLLIDEFENGLHYSVQEKLWEIIFYLAERLNVQVFATTHSLDCVEAFSNILNNGKQSKNAGVMVRLENYETNIEATVYDADEIQATTRVQVDPR